MLTLNLPIAMGVPLDPRTFCHPYK